MTKINNWHRYGTNTVKKLSVSTKVEYIHSLWCISCVRYQQKCVYVHQNIYPRKGKAALVIILINWELPKCPSILTQKVEDYMTMRMNTAVICIGICFFAKAVKYLTCRKEQSFQQMTIEQLDIKNHVLENTFHNLQK